MRKSIQKKHVKKAILLLGLAMITGCTKETQRLSPSSSPDFSLADEMSEETLIPINPTAAITELEPGLSVVQLAGDQGFAQLLEEGGAASDQAVAQFLTQQLTSGSIGYQFPASGFGCSTLTVNDSQGQTLFGRNFDWQSCRALIVLSMPESGYASISMVNLDFITQSMGALSALLSDDLLARAAYYAPLDGMNEAGLAVSVNMIEDQATIEQARGQTDLTTTTAIRFLLNQAQDVPTALELLETLDLHASMGMMIHFAIADAQGNSVAVEYIDNDMVVTSTPILTNFYVASGPKQGIGSSQSHTRYEILNQRLDQKETLNMADVRDALESVSKHNFNEFESTEWSWVFNLATLEAQVYHRENYQSGYVYSLKTLHERKQP